MQELESIRSDALDQIESQKIRIESAVVELKNFIQKSTELRNGRLSARDPSRDVNGLHSRAGELVDSCRPLLGGYCTPAVIFAPVDFEDLLTSDGHLNCLIGRIYVNKYHRGKLSHAASLDVHRCRDRELSMDRGRAGIM